MLFFEISRIALYLWQLVFPEDRRGDSPVRSELEICHASREYWRLAVPGSDDHRHLQHYFIILNDLKQKVGNIHPDVALTKVFRHPTPSFKIQFNLTNPFFNGNIQNFQGFRTDHSVI